MGARGRGGRWSFAAALALGALMAARPVRATDAAPAIRVEIRARETAPGEPVRVVVRTKEPLASLVGSFLDRPLFFVEDPSPGAAPGTSWSAWAVVELDRRPGKALVEASGATRAGGTVRGSAVVRVKDKEFPTQRLDVEPKYVTPPPEVEARIAAERKRLGEVYARRSAGAPPPGPFRRPVDGEPTSPFGARRIFNDKPRDPHPGIDLRAASGTVVRCAGRGRVALAGDLYYSGETVIVDHGGGLFTVYAHLSRIDVRDQDAVDAGTVVGLSGATGRVTGPHLHWGAKIGDLPFDPRALLDPVLW